MRQSTPMILAAIICIFFFPQNSNGGSPANTVTIALQDATRLPPEIAYRTRYLSLYNLRDDDITETIKVLNYHINCLSREYEIVRCRRVSRDLISIDVGHYNIPLEVWERFKDIDPYFHVEVTKSYTDGVGYYKIPGDESSWVWTKKEEKTITKFDHAPWINAQEIEILAKLTKSDVPIIRADWFFYQTAIQKDRIAGYYDFLQVKSRDDFQNLVGLDKELAQRMRREVAAIVDTSGVTLNNRQIFIFDTVAGCYIETRDTKDQIKERNALRQFDNVFKHDAEEIYGTLANGLFAFYLSDPNGVQQDTAPDFIASDNRSTSNDTRVHVPLSCIRCHIEGLRPINDWSRRTFSKASLVSPDFKVQKRLQQLYLSPLVEKIDQHNRSYAQALLLCNGLSPSENASAYGRVWKRYADDLVSPQIMARDVGFEEVELINAIRESPPPIDPVLISLGADPPNPIRREHAEELFSTVMQLMHQRNTDLRNALDKEQEP